MTALADEGSLQSRNLGKVTPWLMVASTTIYKDSIVMINSDGLATPAVASASNWGCVGIATTTITSAASGDYYVGSQTGEFLLAAVSISQSDVGDTCYALDDATIDETQLSNQPRAGLLVGYESSTSGWVLLEPSDGAQGFVAGDAASFSTLHASGAVTAAGTATKVTGNVGLDFNDCRVHNSLVALLPVAGATDDLGNVPGTVGTTAASLQTEDLKAAGATNNIATFSLVVPDWYTAGSTVNLVCSAGMLTTVSDTTATLDIEAWVPDYANADGTVSTDLCGTAATSINSVTLADKSFLIDDDLSGHALAAGSVIQFRITTAVNDGATGTAVIAIIRKIHLAVTT